MRLRVGHISLQFSDTSRQHTQDIERIFDRALRRRYAWITGTEAGPGAGNTTDELVRVGREQGYRMWVPSDTKRRGQASGCWLGVRRDFITSGWKTGFVPGIPGSKELYQERGLDGDLNPKWGPRGIITAEFVNKDLGQITLGVSHYLTKSRSPKQPPIHGVDHWEQNKRLANVIAEWGKEAGAGPALVFYAGDQNMSDSLNDQPQGDTFFDGPFTSLGDELKRWFDTGHGSIDVLASYNKDHRVTAHNWQVFEDDEFFLNTDHFLCEGTYNVEPLAA